MRGRVQVWTGAVIAVMAAVGLGVYLARVGLEDADRLASVFGLFVALAGLGVAVYGVIADRKSGSGDEPDDQGASPADEHPGAVDGDNNGISSAGEGMSTTRMNAAASEQGRIYQAGRDQTINEQ